MEVGTITQCCLTEIVAYFNLFTKQCQSGDHLRALCIRWYFSWYTAWDVAKQFCRALTEQWHQAQQPREVCDVREVYDAVNTFMSCVASSTTVHNSTTILNRQHLSDQPPSLMRIIWIILGPVLSPKHCFILWRIHKPTLQYVPMFQYLQDLQSIIVQEVSNNLPNVFSCHYQVCPSEGQKHACVPCAWLKVVQR